jgi:hypothetical protein
MKPGLQMLPLTLILSPKGRGDGTRSWGWGWGVKLPNEPNSTQAGVENCPEQSQKRSQINGGQHVERKRIESDQRLFRLRSAQAPTTGTTANEIRGYNLSNAVTM